MGVVYYGILRERVCGACYSNRGHTLTPTNHAIKAKNHKISFPHLYGKKGHRKMNTTKSKAPPVRERIERNIVRDGKTGHYLVTKYCGYNDKGIQRTTVTCYILAVARQERDKHEYERKNLGKTSSNTQITVAQCIEQYINEKNLQETTKDNYRTRLKRIVTPLSARKNLFP